VLLLLLFPSLIGGVTGEVIKREVSSLPSISLASIEAGPFSANLFKQENEASSTPSYDYS